MIDTTNRDPIRTQGYTCSYCLTCSGNGRILTPAQNGEGYIPVACDSCIGTGWSPPPAP